MASLIVQLARLGDLLQTLPAITALKARHPGEQLDVLCAAPLVPVVSLFSGVRRALPWDVDRWRQWAAAWSQTPDSILNEAQSYLNGLAPASYDTAYNLNQHPRAVLAAHLMAKNVIGPGHTGPLMDELPAWGAYLRRVARERTANHVHLADAFCGMCGVTPPGTVPQVRSPAVVLSRDLSEVGNREVLWVAVIVGAGDVARCLPPTQWVRWITGLLDAHGGSRVVLIGSAGERDRAQAIQAGLSPLLLGRVWDATGRTDLLQLAALLSRCQWAVGSDTGSLHLAAAVGCRTVGMYFARARVHETGPYGAHHWVWQSSVQIPDEWPIEESLHLILDPSDDLPVADCRGWQLWTGQVDEWGVSFTRPGRPDSLLTERRQVWKDCMAGRIAAGTHPA